MKTTKKKKKILPEVHILGDLQDVKNLVSGVNKKKTIVIFRDGDQETFYLQQGGKFQLILHNDIAYLDKKYKLIFFSFFPSRKNVEELTEKKPKAQKTETAPIRSPKKEELMGMEKNKKEKKEKKEDKRKKEKKMM